MIKTKSTKRALLMSGLALLMCVSMFIGTTFAWFTDSVSSTNNIIKSGNLDVELEYYDGDSWEKVTATTNVFEKNTLWEPGHTEVVYLKVSNLGTLALKYNLGVNIVSEIESINVAGETLRLSDYIKFGVKEGVKTPYADRKAARAAINDADAVILSTGYTKAGSIEAGADAEYVALVVYMPENIGNEANYRTGEVAPEITLGINLMATQYTSEKDSFDNQYDSDAKFGGIPSARTTILSKLPTVTTINGNTETLDAGYVFNTTESYEQAQMNAHRYWHADFVASFDQDVDDAAIGLAGQYDAYSPEWLAFELDGFGDIAANTPVRMLEYAGISMNYEELCSIVKEFSCGAFAVDEAAMAGKTMTVELRIYETTMDPNATSGPANIETGKYVTIGTYSHTFAAVKADDQSDLNAAVVGGASAVELADGNYDLTQVGLNGKDFAISGSKNTVINANTNVNNQFVTNANLVFDGVTVNFGSDNYLGLANTESLTFKNCTINGYQYLYGDNIVFENCELNSTGYAVCVYDAHNVTFKKCTFNTAGKALLLYKDDLVNNVYNVTVEDCTFNASAPAYASAITNQACAAIEIHNYGASYKVTTARNTVDSDFSGEWRIKNFEASKGTTVTVNGTAYTQTALDGHLMTVTNKEATLA